MHVATRKPLKLTRTQKERILRYIDDNCFNSWMLVNLRYNVCPNGYLSLLLLCLQSEANVRDFQNIKYLEIEHVRKDEDGKKWKDKQLRWMCITRTLLTYIAIFFPRINTHTYTLYGISFICRSHLHVVPFLAPFAYSYFIVFNLWQMSVHTNVCQ